MSETIDADTAGHDGRSARGQRTRDMVVDALMALLEEGDAPPGAREVAARAGVSIRTVFAHFPTLEDLYRACVERATARVVSLLTPVDPGLPLAERIDILCTQRAQVNEDIGPVRRAAALKAPFSPTLAEARELGRRASYEQLDRIFATELATLEALVRRRRRAAADAALSGETWDLLRITHSLTTEESRAAVRDAVRPLLSPALPPSAPGAASDPAHASRRAVAQRTLADVEQRIDRLVAAIEAGSPADLLAPRLQELRAARLAAEQALTALGA